MSTPSASIINIFPFLDWLPGPMPWRTRANAYRIRENQLYEDLVREALLRKASGMNMYVINAGYNISHSDTYLHSWAAVFVDENSPQGDQRHLMKQFAAVRISQICPRDMIEHKILTQYHLLLGCHRHGE